MCTAIDHLMFPLCVCVICACACARAPSRARARAPARAPPHAPAPAPAPVPVPAPSHAPARDASGRMCVSRCVYVRACVHAERQCGFICVYIYAEGTQQSVKYMFKDRSN